MRVNDNDTEELYGGITFRMRILSGKRLKQNVTFRFHFAWARHKFNTYVYEYKCSINV